MGKAGKIIVGVLFSCLMFIPLVYAESLPVTSPFGWRIHPISGTWKFHSGVDLGYEYGTPVNVLFPGQVIQAGNYDDGYGNQVLVYHPDYNTYTRYCHMCEVTVNVGDYVESGTIIGYVGSTGYSTGPHLHLEYIISDGSGGYVYADPLSLWGE